MEFNARNQLTLWGPTGQINDYARKEWGGLVRSYYKLRFQLFFKTAEASLKERKPWDQGAFEEALLEQVELPWQTDTTAFPVAPEYDAVATCRAMQAKYGY